MISPSVLHPCLPGGMAPSLYSDAGQAQESTGRMIVKLNKLVIVRHKKLVLIRPNKLVNIRHNKLI